MTSQWTTVFLLFILVSGIILLVMLFGSGRGRGSLRVGSAELNIDFDKGWQKQPKPKATNKAPPAGNSRYFLEVRGTTWRYPLRVPSTIYIGRNPDSQIRLKDHTADSRQAVIYWEDNRFKINNLSHRVATLVNGRRITKQNLGDGNTIQLGRTRIIFRDRTKLQRSRIRVRQVRRWTRLP